MASVIATWPFSYDGVVEASRLLQSRSDALDAMEKGIIVVEEDPDVTSVGYGGLPNSEGVLQLDAAVMTSSGCMGSVMALEHFKCAIPAARLVMVSSPHSILCGSGATNFARAAGLPFVSDASALLSPHAQKRYAEFLKCKQSAEATAYHSDAMKHSDTVGMIVRDAAGDLAVGCATSGMQFKAPGRVGDSPVFGSGLYADSFGAATATGDGDQMLRFSLSFLAVERLRLGDDISAACQFALARLLDHEPKCQAAIVAMDANGKSGAAATHDGFTAITWREGDTIEKLDIKASGTESWIHKCA